MQQANSFADFKNDFYQRVKDLSVFEMRGHNMLKVVLDGLKVNYAARGKVRLYIFGSTARMRWLFRFVKWKNSLKGKSIHAIDTPQHRKYLSIDPGYRTVIVNGFARSFYFTNIHQTLGRDHFVAVGEGNKGKLEDVDVHFSDYNADVVARSVMLTDKHMEMKEALTAFRNSLDRTGIFRVSEMMSISIALQQFFFQYVIWNAFISKQNFEIAYLWPHYHREGTICALKEKAIKVVELQHGLIAGEDIFYVMPDVVKSVAKRAFFADEIWVYGNYWKEQLLKGSGYTSEQIKVAGYFPLTIDPDQKNISEYKRSVNGDQIILVTTQTFMQEYFCRYISFLSEDCSKRKLAGQIFVKLHPAEKIEDYRSIMDLPNIRIVKDNINTLLAACDIHISVYSTTLFDAIKYGVRNYSVYFEPFADYVKGIEASGVATVIQEKENPLDRTETGAIQKPVTYFYEKFLGAPHEERTAQ